MLVRNRVFGQGLSRERGRFLKAEIVGVGTELVLGQIANTNAQHISQALATVGADVSMHVAVCDDVALVEAAVASALTRSDVVVVTGGLGPTPDDLTREAVARVLGRPLVRDESLVRQLREFFAELGREITEDNLRQTDLPEGALAIEPEGTAAGFYTEEGGRLLIVLPGVPWEMQAMLEKAVLPLLRGRGGEGTTLSRDVLVVGLGESQVHAKIADLAAGASNPGISYLASGGQVRVRLTARAPGESAARELIEPLEQQIRARLGRDAVDGYHPSVGAALGALLKDQKMSVAAAESLTAGLIGSQLAELPGASDYFIGSLVCYSIEAKRRLARLEDDVLEDPGPVSAEAAAALAEAAVEVLGADLGLAATGVAGPAPQDGKPVGTVYVGASVGARREVRDLRASGDRNHIRAVAATAALDLGRRLLLE